MRKGNYRIRTYLRMRKQTSLLVQSNELASENVRRVQRHAAGLTGIIIKSEPVVWFAFFVGQAEASNADGP